MGAIEHSSIEVTNTGFPYDRFWMLIDEHNQFISQRKIPELALFKPAFHSAHLVVKFKGEQLEIPLNKKETQQVKTVVWEDEVYAIEEDEKVHQWFSYRLNQDVRLVRKSMFPKRPVKNHPETYVNFADGSQYLIIGEETLNDLNRRLNIPIAMDQFRPNIVFSGGEAFSEDQWHSITIANTQFEATKRCSRCVMITINQTTAKTDAEPLKVLSNYRKWNNKVYFGQFLKLMTKEGEKLSVGDEIRIEQTKNS